MRLIIIFFVTFSFSLFAQDYIDLVRLQYTSTPENNFENSNAATSLQKLGANVTLPISLKNKNVILTGLVYDRLDFSLVPRGSKENFSAVTLKMGMNLKHSEKWSTTFLLLPKLASNFEEKIQKEDFQAGTLILTKKQKSEYLAYKFGVYANTDRFGPFFVPLFGGYYQKEKIEIDAIIPSYAIINYSLSDKLSTGINWRATVRSYNRTAAINIHQTLPLAYIHHLSNEIGGHFNYEPIKGIMLRVTGGVSVGRSIRTYQNLDKIDFGLSLFRFGDERVVLNPDFANGAFLRTEIAYRHYLNRE